MPITSSVTRIGHGARPRLSLAVVGHIALATFAFVGVMLLQQYRPVLYMYFILEDSASEYAGALGFFFASPLFFLAARRSTCRFRRLSLFIAASAALFVGLEEISWGQRIVGVETPAFFGTLNYQNETNIHNLVGFKAIPEQKVAAFLLLVVVGLSLAQSAYRLRALGGRSEVELPAWFEGLPLPPLILAPWAILVVVIFLGSSLIKSDEVGELFLGLFTVAWAMALVVESPARRQMKAQFPILAIMALAIGGGLLLAAAHRADASWRAHMTAFRDYPSRGMYSQALEVAEYILARPGLRRRDTAEQYQGLLRSATEAGVKAKGAGQLLESNQ